MAQSYAKVYSMRAEDPSTTSLMARGIFQAAAKEKLKGKKVPKEPESIWSKLMSLLGVQPESQR